MAKKSVPTDRKAAAATPRKAVVATPAVQTAVHSALDGAGVVNPAPAARSRKRRAGATQDQAVLGATPAPSVSEDQRRGMIALSAYLRAERRGFSPEGQAEDWLAAEKEVDALLNSGHTAPQ